MFYSKLLTEIFYRFLFFCSYCDHILHTIETGARSSLNNLHWRPISYFIGNYVPRHFPLKYLFFRGTYDDDDSVDGATAVACSWEFFSSLKIFSVQFGCIGELHSQQQSVYIKQQYNRAKKKVHNSNYYTIGRR